MKRPLALLAVLVALTLVAIGVMSFVVTQQPGTTVRIAEARGTVSVHRGDGASTPGGVGQALNEQDVVSTGADGRVEIALGAGSLRVGAGSTVLVRSVDRDSVSVELEGGALQATIRPGGGVLRIGNGGRELQATDADFDVAIGPDDLFIAEVGRGEVQTTGIEGLSAIEAGQRASIPSSGKALLQPISDQLLLAVEWPEAKTRAPTTLVRGTTAPGSWVRIERGAAVVDVTADASGVFVAEVPLEDGKKPLTVHARDPLGKVAQVDGVVERDARGPALFGETTYAPLIP